MRVTKELNIKIDRLLDEKYNKLISPLIKERRELEKKRQEEGIKEVITSLGNNPHFKNYVKSRGYGANNSPENYIKSYLSHFIGSLETDVMGIEIDKLKRQKELEKEDIVIGISYGKNMEDIKEIFESKGLKF